MRAAIQHSKHASHDETRVLAYQLWEAADRPDGQDLHFWFTAEQQLLTVIALDGGSAHARPATGKAAAKRPAPAQKMPPAARRATRAKTTSHSL